MKRGWLITWLIITGIICVNYALWLRPLIDAVYQDAAPDWLEQLIQLIYPRFAVEKYRFPIEFFRQRVDQVILRFGLVNGLAILFCWLYSQQATFYRRVTDFWQTETSVRMVQWLRILFYAGLLYFSHDWYGYLTDLSQAAAFFKPISFLRLLGSEFPPRVIIILLYGLLMVSCVSAVLNQKPVMSSVIAAICLMLLQGWLYSFEKFDHTFSTLTYAALLMPFLLHTNQRATQQKQSVQAGWPLQLICLSIGLVYLLSGVEKLLISGLDWVQPDSFRSYLYLHQAPVGLQVAQSDWLCWLLPALALLFELGFISAVFVPKLRGFVLLSGIAFHAGTYLLLHVGWYVSSWIFVYIFFVNWNQVAGYLRRKRS